PAVDQAIHGVHWVRKRTLDRSRAIDALARGDQRLDGALATVGDRDLHDLRIGQRFAHAARDGVGSLGCGEAALERVRRDDDSHINKSNAMWSLRPDSFRPSPERALSRRLPAWLRRGEGPRRGTSVSSAINKDR